MAYRRGGPLIGFTPSFPPFVLLFHLMMALVRLYDLLVFRLKVKGRETLRKLDRALLVSNHTLYFDPGVIAHALRPRRTYFTMLEETALVPFLGTFVRLLGGVPIPERAASLVTLEAAARRALAKLGFLHFFPEGECWQWSQEIQPFRPGAFSLACRLGIPVVPLATVLRESRLFGRSSFRLLGRTLRLPPRVTIVIGEPLRPAVASGETLCTRGAVLTMSRRAREAIQSAIDREGGCRSIFRGKVPRLVKNGARGEPRGPAVSLKERTPRAI